MQTLLTLVLYLIAFSLWLGTIAMTGQYRRARLGPAYRAEQDPAFWLALTLVGGALTLLLAWIPWTIL